MFNRYKHLEQTVTFGTCTVSSVDPQWPWAVSTALAVARDQVTPGWTSGTGGTLCHPAASPCLPLSRFTTSTVTCRAAVFVNCLGQIYNMCAALQTFKFWKWKTSPKTVTSLSPNTHTRKLNDKTRGFVSCVFASWITDVLPLSPDMDYSYFYSLGASGSTINRTNNVLNIVDTFQLEIIMFCVFKLAAWLLSKQYLCVVNDMSNTGQQSPTLKLYLV